MAFESNNAYVSMRGPATPAAAPASIGSILRHTLAVLVSLAMALAAAPAMAQQDRQPAPGQADRALVGLPIYSSDGKRVGRILATGVDDDNQTVLVGEIERPLGIGSDAVAIPFDMFTRQPDRIVLTITAEEVGKRISGTEGKR